MMDSLDFKDLRRRMDGAVESLKSDFAGLRTGRASASLVEPVHVNAYGSKMPLSQVGTVSVPESRMISVHVWDKGLTGAVEKAVRDAGLGLTPVVDGQYVRIPVPRLTQERRIELKKIASRYAEQAKVAIRNIRREGMESIKKLEETGEDDQKKIAADVQSLTDEYVRTVDSVFSSKETEIMQV